MDGAKGWARSLGAVLLGVVTVVATVMLGVMLQSLVFPERYGAVGDVAPPTDMILLNLSYSGLGGVLGGWVAGRLGSHRPIVLGTAVGALILLLNAGGGGTPTAWPGWYAMSLRFLPLTCVVGGYLAGRPHKDS